MKKIFKTRKVSLFLLVIVGTLKGTKAKICLKEGAQPKFVKVRPMPYAMKASFKQKLERLKKEGFITPVPFSEKVYKTRHVPSLPAIVVRKRVQTIHHNNHTRAYTSTTVDHLGCHQHREYSNEQWGTYCMAYPVLLHDKFQLHQSGPGLSTTPSLGVAWSPMESITY